MTIIHIYNDLLSLCFVSAFRDSLEKAQTKQRRNV